jgi:TPR repeat protein
MRFAADKDHAEAQFNMGVYCEHGRGMAPNEHLALDYFTGNTR